MGAIFEKRPSAFGSFGATVRLAALAALALALLVLLAPHHAAWAAPAAEAVPATAAVAAPAATTSAAAASDELSRSIAQDGLLLQIVAIFFAGVAVSLTPCVYPMIPITLSVIGARSVGQRPIFGFLRSLCFVFGIGVLYAGLGYVTAAAGTRFQFLLQQRWFWGVMVAIFFAMGASMMGLFNLQLPASIASRVQTGQNRGGYVGAFLLGLVTGVVASPCGSPVLVSIMTFVAQTGRGVLGSSLMFTYALGMGMLFLVLGTFPGFLKSMPKSGGWMEDVKLLLGGVIIGVGLFYLQYALRNQFVWWCVLAVVSLAAAVAVAAKAPSRGHSPVLKAAWQAVGLMLVVFGLFSAVWAAPSAWNELKAKASPGGTQAGVLAPGASGSGSGSTGTGTASNASATSISLLAAPTAHAADGWLTDEVQALQLAKASGKPIMLDFGADWCTACKELKKITFPDSAVAEALSGFVKVYIDCTESEEGSPSDKLQRKYGVSALPTVVFLDKNGNVLPEVTLNKFEKPAPFIERLKRVK